jgi:hypothetical protein
MFSQFNDRLSSLEAIIASLQIENETLKSSLQNSLRVETIEKVERLERESETLKSNLEKVDRLERENEKLNSRIDKLGSDAADRLGHHVCVGIGGCTDGHYGSTGKPVFRSPHSCDFCQHTNGPNGYCPCQRCGDNQDSHVLVYHLTNGLDVFFVDSLRFFPVFKEFGFDLNWFQGGASMRIDLFDRIVMMEYPKERIFEKGDDADLIRETFLKYGVQLLFDGKPID